MGPAEITDLDGVRMTLPVRSLYFELRYAVSIREAVVAFDMAAYNDLVSAREAWDYALAHPGWTGAPRAREALGLGEENSWSPWETRMRLVWTLDAGLPRPLCNVPIFGLDGRLIGAPDLFDPIVGLVGEYDGQLHLVGAQRARDIRREAAFRAVGLEYVTMLREDHADRGHFIGRLLQAYRRAPRTAESKRRWTITPPSWWTETRTVEQRRALTEHQQARLLGHRRRIL